MDILETLKHDHKKVLDILDKLESTTDRALKTRKKEFEQLKMEILPHMYAEENFFYPYLLDRLSDKDQRESIFEGIEEHYAARSVLNDTQDVSFSDEHWHPDIKVLKELISHHIEEEESEIFDIAKEIVEDRSSAAEEFNRMKKEAKVPS